MKFRIDSGSVEFIIGTLVTVASLISCHQRHDVSAKLLPETVTLVSYAPSLDQIPVFPYGAVYFRKSNPPKEDWDQDYETASQIGMNIFRHWFMWPVIEVAPGKYDWSDYDRQLDLAARYGIKTIIAEQTNSAPQWISEVHPNWRRKTADGTYSTGGGMNGSAAVGSGVGICMDNPEAYCAQTKFLTELIIRYRDHPALSGYDLWNELGGGGTCYCEYCQAKYREWLKAKYGTLEELERAWNQYDLVKWEYVHPPAGDGVSSGGGSAYQYTMDWSEYNTDRMVRLFQQRVELFRKLDPNHLITAHKGGSADLNSNQWSISQMVDVYGVTWVQSRHGDAPWMQFQALDIVRSQARNKPWWHAEAEAGSLWMQPQVPGRAREDGRITYPKDVSLWNMISMTLGAKGILYPRYRPLLDGPLFGAFGPMGMDGSITPKSLEAEKVAKWANAHPELWKSNPVRGDIGILIVNELQHFSISSSRQYYAESVRGAYQAFFDSNIQPDFVQIDNIKEYPVIYLPFAIMLKQATVSKLIEYVQNGGRLICEGTPAYWGDNSHVGEVQPNLGLDKLFGAREKYVEFTPDLLEDLTLQVRGSKINGRYFRQEYTAEGGVVSGTYENGEAAAIENNFGNGKTLLIGTFPGAGYAKSHSPETRKFFAGLLVWGGVVQRISISDDQVQARLHDGAGGKFLWVVNATRNPREVTILLNDRDKILNVQNDIWDGKPVTLINNSVKLSVDEREVAVIPLK